MYVSDIHLTFESLSLPQRVSLNDHLEKRGENPGEFKYPRGLAVDSSGVVYVCDENSNRVQAF